MKNALLALSSVVLACTSCNTFSYVGTETHLRYDKDSDVLTMLEIEHGIYAAPKQSGAVAAVESVANGRRVFPADEGFFHLDFDRTDKDSGAESADTASLRDRKWRAFADGVKITQGGLFLDDAGQLSLYRLWSFANVRAGLELFNEGIDAAIAEYTGEFAPAFPVFDEETRTLWRERAAAHGDWFSTKDGAFVLDVPMTPKCAARCMSHLLAESEKPGAAAIASFWSRVSSLEILNNRAQLRFEPSDDGWFHFESSGNFAFSASGSPHHGGGSPSAGTESPSLAGSLW